MFDLDTSYEYDVYAFGGELFFVAFDRKQIVHDLIEKGVNLTKVDKIYLSQAFFDTFQTPIAISETEALARINGVVVIVDRHLCTEIDDKSELSSLALLKLTPLKVQGLGSKSSGDIKRPLIVMGTVAALWIVMVFVNLFMTQNELLAKMEALRTTYKLPQTSFQLKSMVRRLEKIDMQQHFIREMIHAITQQKRVFSASINKIAINTKYMELQSDKVLDKKAQLVLQKRFKKNAKNVKVYQNTIKATR
jgi:hypothetical protein